MDFLLVFARRKVKVEELAGVGEVSIVREGEEGRINPEQRQKPLFLHPSRGIRYRTCSFVPFPVLVPFVGQQNVPNGADRMFWAAGGQKRGSDVF